MRIGLDDRIICASPTVRGSSAGIPEGNGIDVAPARSGDQSAAEARAAAFYCRGLSTDALSEGAPVSFG